MYAQWNRIYVINNKLYRGWTSKDENNKTLIFQYMVPQQQRDEILRLAHDTELSGHLGVEKTQNRIKQRYFWPGWESVVRQYVLSCPTCQQVKAITQHNEAPLQPNSFKLSVRNNHS
jgi:hypothetical protein